MRKRFVGTMAGLVLALTSAVPALAVDITFDPDGNPVTVNNVQINAFDLKFGNGIALNLTGLSGNTTAGTFLFQANLNTGDLNNVTQFASCVGGADCFTVVAILSETITSNADGTIKFEFNPNGENLFRIYATDTQQGDPLTGNCFANGTGCISKTLVLAGTFLNDGSFSSSFTVNLDPITGLPTLAPLDSFPNPGNSYPTTQSVTGNGSFQGNIDLFTTINPLYFPSGVPGGFFFQSSSQQSLPYNIVDPSACFSRDGITGGATGAFAGTATPCFNQSGVGTVGATNGLSGPNTMLQTHAGLSFLGQQAGVPEPASLTLLGLGLVGAAARRRQLRNAKK